MSLFNQDLPHPPRPQFAVERWRLLVDGRDPVMSQAAQLRIFTHRAVLGAGATLADYVNIGLEDDDARGVRAGEVRDGGSIGAAAARMPGGGEHAPYFGQLQTPDRIVAFDLESLLWARDYPKVAVLAPESVPALLAEHDPARDSDAWTLVETLQQALICTNPVVVFDRAQARDLAIHGAAFVVDVTMPAFAIASLAEDEDRGCILVIDHLHEAALLQAASDTLREAFPEFEVLTWSNTPANRTERGASWAAAHRAVVHVHIGSGQEARRPRIVDSYAWRKPVVLLQPIDRPTRSDSAPHERVEHLRSGLVANDAATLAAAVRRIVQDTAGVDVFRRNGERRAESLNHAVAERLREILA